MRLFQVVLSNSLFSSVDLVARIYWNRVSQEYVVKFYKDGVYQEEADYFTEDREDAVNTAKHFVKGN